MYTRNGLFKMNNARGSSPFAFAIVPRVFRLFFVCFLFRYPKQIHAMSQRKIRPCSASNAAKPARESQGMRPVEQKPRRCIKPPPSDSRYRYRKKHMVFPCNSRANGYYPVIPFKFSDGIVYHFNTYKNSQIASPEMTFAEEFFLNDDTYLALFVFSNVNGSGFRDVLICQ